MIEKTKESQMQSMAELQQELKSLKALLLSRGPSISNGASTPLLPGKPSIPAWQLAGPTQTAAASSISLPSSPGLLSGPPNGKGNDVDVLSPPSST